MIHVQNSSLYRSVFVFIGQHTRNNTFTYPVSRLLLMMNEKRQQLIHNSHCTQPTPKINAAQLIGIYIKQSVSSRLANTVILHYQKQTFHSLFMSVINET